MTLVKTLFGLGGRLTRGSFFWRLGLILVLFVLANAVLTRLIGANNVWFINPLVLWALCAAAGQRLHDRGLSGRWLLVGLVPVVGALWLLWQVSCKGVGYDNRWGTQPSRVDGSFLVVK